MTNEPRTNESGRLRRFARQLFRFRATWFGSGHFSVLVTHWFYFSNHHYPGERRYFVRVGEWRRNFG